MYPKNFTVTKTTNIKLTVFDNDIGDYALRKVRLEKGFYFVKIKTTPKYIEYWVNIGEWDEAGIRITRTSLNSLILKGVVKEEATCKK